MSGPKITTKTHYFTGEQMNYTAVTVKDKDSGKSFVINFKNSIVKGNQAEWTIKDGRLYDKDGKAIEDNIMEVTRYQAALIKAADATEDSFIDEEDLNGSEYAYNATQELAKNKSEYKVDSYNLGTYKEPVIIQDADATEGGIIYANVINKDGETGHLSIDIRTPEQLEAEAQRNAEYQAILDNYENKNKSWFRKVLDFLSR